MEWTDLFSPTKEPARPVRLVKPTKAVNKPKLPSLSSITSENGNRIESLEWTDIFGPKKKTAFKPNLPSILSSLSSSENVGRIKSLEWTDIFGSKKEAANKSILSINGSENQNIFESTEKSVTPTSSSTQTAALDDKTEDFGPHFSNSSSKEEKEDPKQHSQTIMI